MWRKFIFLAAPAAALAGLVLYAGCSRSPTETPQAAAGTAPEKKQTAEARTGEHTHKPGSHGGQVVEIGFDNYHAEIVLEKGGTFRLYTLARDESRIMEVAKQELTAYLKPEDAADAVAVTLKPLPQQGDAEGKTSQFVGRLPAELEGKRVTATVPSIAIAGERFRFAFTLGEQEQHAEVMPVKAAGEEESELYLTPGGLYTEADIQANGNTTASRKFSGIKPVHDAHPWPGDKLCPISLTKANAKFTWIIGGQAYEFCCPPCVDEFLRKAKEHPEEIRDPQEYVQK
jgi:YHS domain-containing protein